MTDPSPLYTGLAAAYVRGKLRHQRDEPSSLFDLPLAELGETEFQALIDLGRQRGLRLHRFKRSMELPRVTRVLGVLKGIQPKDLLDVGSGRGAFLWPLLNTFPWLPVTAVDVLGYRVADIQAVHDGGVEELAAIQGDIRSLAFDEGSFDAVTLLEVLEHISEPERALAAVCRTARRFVVLSVPSQPDNNPEHIHLFSAALLEPMLLAAGALRVTFDYAPGHIIAVARTGR